MGVDVQILVDKIKAILFAIVAKNVMFFVGIPKLHDLASDQVADAAPHVDEGEAVGGDPET